MENEKKLDLLDQAIIDANQIKETALENAKNMLEDQLSDKLKKMIEEQQSDDGEKENENFNESDQFNDIDKDNSKDIISESTDELNEDDDRELDIQLEQDEDEEDEFEDDGEDEDEDEKDEDNINEEDEDIDLSNIIEDEDDETDSFDLNEVEDHDEELEIDLDDDLTESDNLVNNEDNNIHSTLSYKFLKLKEKNKSLTEDLNRYEAGLKTLNKRLNEYSLLNNKLMYSNKLFKEYDLNQDQKYQIINRLDEGESLREIKLLYETLRDTYKSAKIGLEENTHMGFSSDVKNFNRSNKDKIMTEKQEDDDAFNKMKSRFKQLAFEK